MRTTLLAALAVLAFTAPPALADEPEYDCGYEFIGDQVLAYGVVAHAGDDVTITCTIKVNGVERGRTPTGTGTTVATTWGTIAYTADPLDDLQWCAIATVSGHDEFRRCSWFDTMELPPPLG